LLILFLSIFFHEKKFFAILSKENRDLTYKKPSKKPKQRAKGPIM